MVLFCALLAKKCNEQIIISMHFQCINDDKRLSCFVDSMRLQRLLQIIINMLIAC